MTQLVKFCIAVISLTDILLHQDIAQPIRKLLGWEHDRFGNTDYRKNKNSKILEFFGKASECFRCTSMWVAIFLIAVPCSGKIQTILVGSWVASELNYILNKYIYSN